ncbi:MAG: GvpL/GvpF family gas vesicle protein [Planctomycetes bacterium]|nr:GvpL/GvpF family gas vesicle protein [Planctomycetota bacterium]
MKRLIYCILEDKRPLPAGLPPGIDGHPVSHLHEAGLVAVYSTAPNAFSTPSLDHAKAYGRVVNALHQVRTVLPMRYGAMLETQDQVADLLRVRREEFLTSLREVEDCVEMGLRILLKTRAPRGKGSGPSTVAPAHADGASYLLARKRHYAQLDASARGADALAEKYKAAFKGLFVTCKTESSLLPTSNTDIALASLFFLVKRKYEETFREAFRRLSSAESERILLSGPWPPYNFAGPAPERARQDGGEPQAEFRRAAEPEGTPREAPGSLLEPRAIGSC